MSKLSVTLPDGRTLWFKDHTRDGRKVKGLGLDHDMQEYPLMAVLDGGFVQQHTYDGLWHRDGPHGFDLIPCEPDEAPAPQEPRHEPQILNRVLPTPAPVVHPISAEHKLVVGDRVRSARQGEGVVTRVYGDECWGEGIPRGRAAKVEGFMYGFHVATGKAYGADDACYDELTRIAHAGQVPGLPTELERQKAELLEGADRVKHQIDQVAKQTENLTDEALEGELMRRRASPARQLAELREDWLSSPVVAVEYNAEWLDRFEQYARLDERERIKRQGGAA